MATGALDANGIWQYGEDDSETTFSGLLNKLASSTSDTVTRLESFTGFTGTLPVARGGTGQTTIAGIQSALGFRILQVVQASSTTATTTSSTSFVDTTLTASITPSSTASKILIMVTATVEVSNNSCFATVFRGTATGTNLGNGTNGLIRVNSPQNMNSVLSTMVLDSPSTTGSTQYMFGIRTTNSTIYLNPVATKSTITLFEVRG